MCYILNYLYFIVILSGFVICYYHIYSDKITLKMRKGINVFVLGILTVVSVLLALPFAQMRNSFKTVTTHAAQNALTSIGVDLHGQIKNARQIVNSHKYEANTFNINDKNGVSNDPQWSSNFGLKEIFFGESSDLSAEKEAAHTNSGLPEEIASGSVRKGVSKIGRFVSVSSKMSSSKDATQTIGGSIKQMANRD